MKFLAAKLTLFTALAVVSGRASAVGGPPMPAKGSFLYDLSSSTGPATSSWASLTYDRDHREVFVVDTTDGTVGIFNDAGMEVFRFGDDSDLGAVIAVAALEDGDLLALSYLAGKPKLFRCNFRGELKGEVKLEGVPAEISGSFSPTALVYQNQKLYLADKGGMKVVVADLSGACLASFDLLKLMKIEAKHRNDATMHAFNVDHEGNLLFTDAPLFKVFVVSPAGAIRSFGVHGGSPGKFNITGGVARDEQGRFFVSDVLRGVVSVFDQDFEFLGDFGERGWAPGQLIAPLDLAVADGKVFVSQSAGRGVSVFKYTVELPATVDVHQQPQS